MALLPTKLKNAWNAFVENEKAPQFVPYSSGMSYGVRPGSLRSHSTSERSIMATIMTRVAMDVAAVSMRHVRLDENERYVETVVSGLNECLTLSANVDQPARAFKQDVAMTLLEKGTIAIVPVDTSSRPSITGAYDILTMRVGEVTQWYPQHVRVSLYNERSGMREELVLPKREVAIVENPLYAIMNEPNSTLQRLTRKLSILDIVDEAAGSGKLDLIIQLPYVIKSEGRKSQAEQRRADIETQLKGSKYGIAYTDGTEKITQLNRPAESNLLKQIEYLTNLLYSQMGITAEILNGTASELVMVNYHNRTIEPILSAIAESMKRTFLTKTARTQMQSIEFYRDPFKLVAVSDVAEIADKFTRNEILSSNEVRGIIGFKPVGDANADALRNKNLPQPAIEGEVVEEEYVDENGDPYEEEVVDAEEEEEIEAEEEEEDLPEVPDTDEADTLFEKALAEIEEKIIKQLSSLGGE